MIFTNHDRISIYIAIITTLFLNIVEHENIKNISLKI